MATLAELELLRHVPPFAGLGERQLHAIGDACETVALRPGSVLTRSGAPPEALYVILSGQLRVVDDRGAGQPILIDDIGRGTHAGEAVIDGGLAPFSVSCTTEVEALKLGADRLRPVLDAWPEVDAALRDHVVRRDQLGSEDYAGPVEADSRGTGARAAGEPVGGSAAREPVPDKGAHTTWPRFDAGEIAWKQPAAVTGRPPRRFPLVRQLQVSDAGPACLASVAGHYGRKVGLNAAREQAASRRRPPTLAALRRAADRLGFETAAGLATVEHLSHSAIPAIAGWTGGHWVVVVRVHGGRVTVGDPALGVRSLTAAAFAEEWTGEVLYLRPTDRFLEHPERSLPMARFAAYLRPLRVVLAEIVLASVLAQVLALLLPVFARFVIDDVIARRDEAWLWTAFLGMCGVLLLSWAVGFARQYLLNFLSRQVDAHLSGDVFRHLLALPLRFFESRHAGEAVRHFEETSAITSFLTGTGVGFMLEMVTAAIAAALMLHYDARLAAVALAVVVLEVGQLYVATHRLGRGLTGTFRTEVDSEGLLLESFSGLSTIKALAIEHFTRWKLEGRLVARINASFATLRYRALSVLGSQTIGFLGPIAVLFYGAVLVLRGEMTVGVLVAFLLLARMLSAPFATLIAAWGRLQDALASIEEVNDILDTPRESPEEPADQVVLQRVQGHIRFDGVSFRYEDDGPEALGEVSFECYGGQRIAVVGPSGSGKTTLLKLLLGFYRPTGGTIRVDGFDLGQIWLPSYRRQAGVVLQDPRLFTGALRANISQTMPAAPLAEVVSAARMANAHAFISRLPHGYETRLEENGANLSGGQRQQVAIARALLHRPRLLVLDEATSNLDEESERSVQQSLDLHFRDCTVFMITQRLAAVRQADLVLVLDRGRIVEQGPPEQLMAKQGLFYRMAVAQDPARG